ncbi:ribbon-helix-helix domain-containing protein [Candidatus Magnetominusculus dajiuhuensis]|uniref:ribbon-helix-helix domain-containing protein n=1 Tax=Candidatus Magnetominusculus dajiuhuensis TaxID=3137712 RepID=UPI003B439248
MARERDGVQRETFSTRLNPELLKKLKYLAVEEGKKLNELIEEAVALLLADYKRRKGRLFD